MQRRAKSAEPRRTGEDKRKIRAMPCPTGSDPERAWRAASKAPRRDRTKPRRASTKERNEGAENCCLLPPPPYLSRSESYLRRLIAHPTKAPTIRRSPAVNGTALFSPRSSSAAAVAIRHAAAPPAEPPSLLGVAEELPATTAFGSHLCLPPLLLLAGVGGVVAAVVGWRNMRRTSKRIEGG